MIENIENESRFIEIGDDLRKIDEKGFLTLVERLRELTKNFTEFEQVIRDKPQVLLILRCLVGMKRREFSSVIGINEENLRKIEVGELKIKRASKINKINSNLKEIFSETSEVNIENALELFKEVAIPTCNGEVIRIKDELSSMNLPEDLRKMNDEQFIKVLEWLREKTDGFKKFPEEVFLANNQIILILRCALGMTRPSFARKVGINQETLRFVEMNRKENRIRTLGVAKRWCKRITEFLKSNKIEVDKERALLVWRVIKEKQTGEKDIKRENEIRKILESLQLPEDLREMNETQFITLFNKIKEITQNFKELPIELITARSDIILILRLATGLSRKEFCTKTGIPLDALRHVEKGIRVIKNGAPALRWIKVLLSILKEKSDEIKLEKALMAFKSFKGKKEVGVNDKMKAVMKMNIEEVKEFFKEMKRETQNFTDLSFDKIRKEPRIISIIRIMLNKSIPEFSAIIGKDESWLRRWENGKIKLSIKNSIFLSQKLEELIKNVDISEENFIRNFIELHHVKSNEINENLKKALKAMKKMKPTKSELEIINILNELNLPFTLHANIDCIKRIENFDIAIPNEVNPMCVIEVTETKKVSGNFRTKLMVTDHKFQMIKSVSPHVKTVCFARINDFASIKEKTKEMLVSELLNTDFLFINETEGLKRFLQEFTS